MYVGFSSQYGGTDTRIYKSGEFATSMVKGVHCKGWQSTETHKYLYGNECFASGKYYSLGNYSQEQNKCTSGPCPMPTYMVFESEHEIFKTGVEGIQLTCSLPPTVCTSGNKTSNYGDVAGWEIVE